MPYFLSFLEGMITFISPCLLPMLPVYVSYFAGGKASLKRTLQNALGFVLGFTLVFLALGALAGTFGALLSKYATLLNLLTGLIVVIFGLSYTGLFSLPFFRGNSLRMNPQGLGFFSSILFGVVFSLGWTPCVGAFLGSALMMASREGETLAGIFMLLAYSLGLGIPFLLSALLIDRLKGAFTFIKSHYRVINLVCGILLVIVGLSMMTGLLGRLLNVLSL